MPQVTYLEFSEGQEHKFYEVTLDNAELTIRYGRIGTDGQTTQKIFADAAKAQAEASKKIAEKRKKGYSDAVKGQTAKKAIERPDLSLPKTLEPYREKIEATVRPVVMLELVAKAAQPWQSKVGGIPYRLAGTPWPKNEDGEALLFLAQLNFSELPALPDFPGRGLLQFFVGADDLYGCPMEGAPTGKEQSYRVIFHEDIVQDTSKLDITVPKSPEDDAYSPLEEGTEYALKGKLSRQYITSGDHQFEKLVGIPFFDESAWPEDTDLEELYERYGKAARGKGYGEQQHQMGGYPTFTQADPRPTNSPYVLLFQLDSDVGRGILWGDVGIGNFFIRPDHLKKKDFSRVWYNWDCG